MFLVPSFCMVGNGFFVPGPFLVGFGGMKVGMSVMHLTLFSNLTVNSPYIHAPNLIAGFHVKVMPRIFVWIPVPHAQSWSRHCECCLVCLAVLRRHWTQQVQKRRLLFARNHALHPWTLSLCVCTLALVVAVLIAYDYECGRKLSASLFLGSQNQAFLASWLWALIVYIYISIRRYTLLGSNISLHKVCLSGWFSELSLWWDMDEPFPRG